MSDDDTELPFTLFVAGAQLLVGIGLIAFASSTAVSIIGAVVVAFALLTGLSAWYHARQRRQRSDVDLKEWDEPAGAGPGPSASAGPDELGSPGPDELGSPGPDELGRVPAPHSTQGPRQPPEPEGSRSASSGPHDLGE